MLPSIDDDASLVYEELQKLKSAGDISIEFWIYRLGLSRPFAPSINIFFKSQTLIEQSEKLAAINYLDSKF